MIKDRIVLGTKSKEVQVEREDDFSLDTVSCDHIEESEPVLNMQLGTYGKKNTNQARYRGTSELYSILSV